MKKTKFRCCHCRRLYPVRVLGQAYCGDAACQRARKNKWRREKYASDKDYRLNQKSSTDAWLSTVGGSAKYHREYRKQKSQFQKQYMEAKAALVLQKKVALPLLETPFVDDSSGGKSANSDAMPAETIIIPGRYQISPVGFGAANSDALIAEIRVISYG
jgi:hypothetical protein